MPITRRNVFILSMLLALHIAALVTMPRGALDASRVSLASKTPASDARPERVSLLMLYPLPAAPVRRSPPQEALAHQPQKTLPSSRPASPAPASARPEPASVTAVVPVALAVAVAVAAPADTPAPPSADAIRQQAMADIGKIDRELRAGKPVTLQPDASSYQQKLASAFAQAYVGTGDDTELRYTAADGVTYTKHTMQGQTRCYASGTLNYVPGILHDSARAKAVPCPPAGSGWSRQ
jgi:hypothetical protein